MVFKNFPKFGKNEFGTAKVQLCLISLSECKLVKIANLNISLSKSPVKFVALGDGIATVVLSADMPVATAVATPAATATAVTSMRCRSGIKIKIRTLNFPNRDPREDKERFRP